MDSFRQKTHCNFPLQAKKKEFGPKTFFLRFLRHFQLFFVDFLVLSLTIPMQIVAKNMFMDGVTTLYGTQKEISSHLEKMDFWKFLVDFLLSCLIIPTWLLLNVQYIIAMQLELICYHFDHFATLLRQEVAENACTRVLQVYIGSKNSS